MFDVPIFVKWNGEIDRQDRVAFRAEVIAMNDEHVALRAIEEEIADWYFRRPIPLPIVPFAIRPFWRDNQVAPTLPIDTTIYRPSHHY